MKKKLVLASLFIGLTLLTTYAVASMLMYRSFDVAIHVSSHGITLYEDVDCTVVLTSMDFPNISLDGMAEQIFYIKNTGELGDVDVCWFMVGGSNVTLTASEANGLMRCDIAHNPHGYVGQVWLTKGGQTWASLNHTTPHYYTLSEDQSFEARFRIDFNANTPSEGLDVELKVCVTAHTP